MMQAFSTLLGTNRLSLPGAGGEKELRGGAGGGSAEEGDRNEDGRGMAEGVVEGERLRMGIPVPPWFVLGWALNEEMERTGLGTIARRKVDMINSRGTTPGNVDMVTTLIKVKKKYFLESKNGQNLHSGIF